MTAVALITHANELQNVFSGFVAKGIRAVVISPDPITSANEGWIAMLATKDQLLSVSGARTYAEYGGLLAYGPVLNDLSSRAAAFILKILNGAKPSDLPVEEPSRFQLTVNLRTAEFFNLSLPTSILVRADKVIE